ncbi:hypothetical protein Tco_0179118 [Tanacetum coccineum]
MMSFSDYYASRFCDPGIRHGVINFNFPNRLNIDQSGELEAPISRDEIRFRGLQHDWLFHLPYAFKYLGNMGRRKQSSIGHGTETVKKLKMSLSSLEAQNSSIGCRSTSSQDRFDSVAAKMTLLLFDSSVVTQEVGKICTLSRISDLLEQWCILTGDRRSGPSDGSSRSPSSLQSSSNQVLERCFTLPGGVSGHKRNHLLFSDSNLQKKVILQVRGSKLKDGVHVNDDDQSGTPRE